MGEPHAGQQIIFPKVSDFLIFLLEAFKLLGLLFSFGALKISSNDTSSLEILKILSNSCNYSSPFEIFTKRPIK